MKKQFVYFQQKQWEFNQKLIDENSRTNLLNNTILPIDSPKSWQLRHGCSLALVAILHYNPSLFSNPKFQKSILNLVFKYLNDEKVPVRQTACEVIGKIVTQDEVANSAMLSELLTPMSDLLSDESGDVKITILKVIKKSCEEISAGY